MSCQSQETVPSRSSPKSPEKDELFLRFDFRPRWGSPFCSVSCVPLVFHRVLRTGQQCMVELPLELGPLFFGSSLQNSLSCPYPQRSAQQAPGSCSGLSTYGLTISWAEALSFGTAFPQLVLKFPHTLGGSGYVLAGIQAAEAQIWQGCFYSCR